MTSFNYINAVTTMLVTREESLTSLTILQGPRTIRDVIPNSLIGDKYDIDLEYYYTVLSTRHTRDRACSYL